MNIEKVKELARLGESETLEFKKTTGQLSAAMETLCGFLNGKGGMVLIGVGSDGEVKGQEIGESTLGKIAGKIRLFEPPAPISIERIPIVKGGKEVIVLSVITTDDTRPFTFDGRPFSRLGATTSVMPHSLARSSLQRRIR